MLEIERQRAPSREVEFGSDWPVSGAEHGANGGPWKSIQPFPTTGMVRRKTHQTD